MILVWLIAIPFIGGIIAWISEHFVKNAARVISSIVMLFCAVLVIYAWYLGESMTSMEDVWLIEWRYPWISTWGIEFHFGMDGLSFILVLLTYAMGFFALLISKRTPDRNEGFFYFCTMWIVAGTAGVLLSIDLFLFFVFWEIVLLPIYFMIIIWGGQNKNFAAIQFFLFTQASGLILFVSILAMAFLNHAETQVFTFDYNQLVAVHLPHPYGFLILLGFLFAFLVKLPAFPFHVWMPPLFVESPSAPLMVGIMVKTGAYGLLRFVLPFFPTEMEAVIPWMFLLGLISIIYGGVVAFYQTNPQKVLAYMTISHLGLILIGIFSLDDLALSGVVILLVTQALSTGALFMLFAQVQGSSVPIDVTKTSGIFAVAPELTLFSLFFIVALLGIPGVGNFVGEWLVLLSVFTNYTWIAVIAASGIVLVTIYLLWLTQRLFYGPYKNDRELVDVSVRQKVGYGLVALLLLWIGIQPSPILDVVSSTWQEVVSESEEMLHSKRGIQNTGIKVGENS